jgi:hypothetical protein
MIVIKLLFGFELDVVVGAIVKIVGDGLSEGLLRSIVVGLGESVKTGISVVVVVVDAGAGIGAGEEEAAGRGSGEEEGWTTMVEVMVLCLWTVVVRVSDSDVGIGCVSVSSGEVVAGTGVVMGEEEGWKSDNGSGEAAVGDGTKVGIVERFGGACDTEVAGNDDSGNVDGAGPIGASVLAIIEVVAGALVAVANPVSESVSCDAFCTSLVDTLAEATTLVLSPLIPRIASALVLSVHPTKTPCVVFIGKAKHSCPALLSQTCLITKLPSESQFPTFPDIQATCEFVQGEEKLRPVKRVLYALACAKLAA